MRLQSVEDSFNQFVDGVFVASVSLFDAAVGNNHAEGNGFMTHKGCKASKGRALHFEVGDVETIVRERLYLLVLTRVGKRDAEFATLRTKESSTCDGDASYHVVFSNALYHFFVGIDRIWIRLTHVARPTEVSNELALEFKVTNLITSGIEIEQTIEAY